MNIENLIKEHIEHNKRNVKAHNRMLILIEALNNKEIPEEIANQINKDIASLNSFSGEDKEFTKALNKTYFKILSLVEKELKLVPKNQYRNRWLAIGMAVFGIPLGAAFSASTGNSGSLGIGIPIGMVIGMAIGSQMDKKAEKENKQLDLES